MAVRRFLAWPDPCLRGISAPVGKVDQDVLSLWQDMLDTMYAMPGIGLAAPQIGRALRLAVVDCSGGRGSDKAIRLANPEVLHQSGRLTEEVEASPNLPGVSARISRPRAVTVGYLDQDGRAVEKEFVGLWAVSVQHQIDHLNGKMYFDHLSPVRRRMLLARSAKMARRKSA